MLDYKVVQIGYEDFNLVLSTDKDKYFIKLFADYRSLNECRDYLGKITAAVEAKISHPALIKSVSGYLHTVHIEDKDLHFCVMEYIDGSDFYSLNIPPTVEEIAFIVGQAAQINCLNIKPKFVYDSWAITSFLNEFDKSFRLLETEDKELLEPLALQAKTLNFEKLPHAFVHGDIISTNVIKAKDGKIYIIDFGVSNRYPRIQELAMLLSDLLFYPEKEKFLLNYHTALKAYQKVIKLEPQEIQTLPLYVKLAHAMHIIPPTLEKVLNNNYSRQNEYWIQSGRAGLRFLNEFDQSLFSV